MLSGFEPSVLLPSLFGQCHFKLDYHPLLVALRLERTV
jgi:hypothetical protein